jgi:hypothetical protein
MFGGYSINGQLNDLWRYDMTTGWTLLSGTGAVNKVGVYHRDDSGTPGARSGSVLWFNHTASSVWLLGGYVAANRSNVNPTVARAV